MEYLSYGDSDQSHEAQQQQHLSRSVTISAALCAIIFSVVGFLGNLVTIIALLRCSKLRKHTTTAFVLNLSLSDLIFSAVNLPLVSSRYFFVEWVLGDTLCRLFPLLFYGNVAVSLLSMVAIAINRYVLITRPEVYKNRFSKNGCILQMMGAIWLTSFLLLTPPLFEWWGSFGLDRRTFSCTILRKDGASPKKAIFFLGCILPFFVIVISYSLIYLHIARSRKKLAAHEPSLPSLPRSSSSRSDSRVTRLMLTIFICFALCFMPLMLANTIDDGNKMPVVHVVASILAWASAVINPFIYASSSKLYRQAYRQLLCCCTRPSHKGQQQQQQQPTSSKMST